MPNIHEEINAFLEPLMPLIDKYIEDHPHLRHAMTLGFYAALAEGTQMCQAIQQHHTCTRIMLGRGETLLLIAIIAPEAVEQMFVHLQESIQNTITYVDFKAYLDEHKI